MTMQPENSDDADRLAALIEPLAVAAWPAQEVLSCEGWLLRFTSGFTHRGNSVATFAFGGANVEGAIAWAEAEYRTRNLAPMFQIATHTEPVDLAERLAARGYETVSPTYVRVATPAAMRENLPDPGDVVLTAHPSDAFVRLVVEGSRSEGDGRERIEILNRIDAPHICVVASTGGQVVACGTATKIGDYVGVNLMRTQAAHRCQGHAQRVLAAIAGWATEHQAQWVHLGVEMANFSAVALYAKAGFQPAYSYRYFRKS